MKQICLISLLSIACSALGQLPTNHQMSNLPPAIIQGIGLCVPTACAYVASWEKADKDAWIYAKHDSIENLKYQMNPMFNVILTHLPGMPSGSEPTMIFRHMCDQGTIDMAAMPYDPLNDSTVPSLKLRYQALKNRADYTEELYSYLREIPKEWLQTSPIVGIFSWGGTNAHTVMISGYDDSYNYGNGLIGSWAIENSAGPGWGDNGCGWSPYNGAQHMFEFGRMISKVYPLPEFVIQMKSNFFRRNMNKVPDSLMELKFSFTNGADTLKNLYFHHWPISYDYLFPVDTLAQIKNATELTVSCTYQVWRYNETAQPAQMEIDSLATVTVEGVKVPLTFARSRTDAILDSVQENPTLISRLFYSQLIAKMNIGSSNVIPIKQTNLSIYPNPLVSRVTLLFNNATNNRVNLDAYDVTGRLVQKIWTGDLPCGEQKISWTNSLPSGVYLIQLSTNSSTTTKKIVVR